MQIPKSLFRYRNISSADSYQRELKTIREHYLWFSKFSALNDPMEAYFEVDSLGIFKNIDIIAKPYGDLKEIARNSAVSCFNNQFDNSMLWGLYADEHKGICIEYDPLPLIDWLVEEQALLKVKYQNSAPSLSMPSEISSRDDIIASFTSLVATKHSDWASENEYRLLRPSDQKFIHHPDAIKAIYLGARLKDPIKIQSLLEIGKQLNKPIIQCKISGYSIATEILADKTPEEQSSITDAQIHLAKNYDLQLKPGMLEQVLNIVNNDPFVRKITDCDLSVTHGDSNIIWISYELNAHYDSENPAENNRKAKMYFDVKGDTPIRIWGLNK